MSGKNTPNTDIKKILREVILDLESIVKKIDDSVTNNSSLDDKARQVGPYLNEEIEKVLFSARTFSK